MSRRRYHYDGDYAPRAQNGDVVIEDLLLEKSRIYRVPYHQARASFMAAEPSYNDRGEAGKPWANLPVVEISPTTDLGGGVCGYVISYARVPRPRKEYTRISFEFQRISGGNIDSLSKTVTAEVTWTYLYTLIPGNIACASVFKAMKVGADIVFVGDEPGPGATQFLGEDESKDRWMGNIYWKKTVMIGAPAYQIRA